MFLRDKPTVDAGLAAVREPPRPAPAGSRLTTTVLVSVVLHAVALAAALLFLRGVPVPIEPEKLAEVELVMEEHAGDKGPTAAPAATPSPERQDSAPPRDQPAPAAEDTTRPDKTRDAAPSDPTETAAPARAADPSPPTAVPAKAAEPAPPPKPEAPPPAPPAKTAEQVAPKISLSGTDSPSDARAFGARVIPAAPDSVFHNRPPEYPIEAQVAGEHGTVVLMVRVSPAGRAAGVDVLRSSGFIELDQSARDAVSRWRFLPPVQAGRTIAGAMTVSIVFGDD